MGDVPYITRDVMPVRPWHLRTLLLKACFQPQNGHSKAKNDHELSDLSCSIMHLAWSPNPPQKVNKKVLEILKIRCIFIVMILSIHIVP
jgi:hypothetical protein